LITVLGVADEIEFSRQKHPPLIKGGRLAIQNAWLKAERNEPLLPLSRARVVVPTFDWADRAQIAYLASSLKAETVAKALPLRDELVLVVLHTFFILGHFSERDKWKENSLSL